MNLDQPRLASSRLLAAQAFERDRAAHTKPEPHDAATWLLEQLQTAGWRPPPDPAADVPALRPDRIATDAERRAAMTTIRAIFAQPTSSSTGHADH
jgi:hypothetical protein